MGQYKDATRRWKKLNAEKAEQPCICGKPWTNVKTLSCNMGSEPVRIYLCDDGRGSDGASMRDGRMVHTFAHPEPCPQGETWATVGPIGKPPTQFSCPHRKH